MADYAGVYTRVDKAKQALRSDTTTGNLRIGSATDDHITDGQFRDRLRATEREMTARLSAIYATAAVPGDSEVALDLSGADNLAKAILATIAEQKNTVRVWDYLMQPSGATRPGSLQRIADEAEAMMMRLLSREIALGGVTSCSTVTPLASVVDEADLTTVVRFETYDSTEW